MSASGTQGTGGAAGGGSQEDIRNNPATVPETAALLFDDMEQYMQYQRQQMQTALLQNQAWFQNQFGMSGYGVARFTGPAVTNVYQFQQPGYYNLAFNNYEEHPINTGYPSQHQPVVITRYTQSQPALPTEFAMDNGAVTESETGELTIVGTTTTAASHEAEGMDDGYENGVVTSDMLMVESNGERETETKDKQDAAVAPIDYVDERGTGEDDVDRVEGREVGKEEAKDSDLGDIEFKYEMEEEMDFVCGEIDQMLLFEKKA